MLKKHAQLFEGLFTATDLVVVSLSWLCSYWIRFHSGWIEVDKGVPVFADYLRVLVFVWLIWAFVFRRFKLYRPMRGGSRVREVWLIVKANSFAVMLFLATSYLFWEKSIPLSRLVFAIFWALSIILLVASRTIVRSFLRALRLRGYNRRYSIVLGDGEVARELARRVLHHPEFGVELLGCLAGDPAKVGAVVVEGEHPVKFVGTYHDLPQFLHRVDQVVIALPLSDHDRMGAVLAAIGDSMVDVKIVPDLHQFIKLGALVEDFDGLPVVSVASTPLIGINRLLKRSVDILFGALFFMAALPAMLIIAAIIRLTSRGPIFFVQERVGLDGRRFAIYKFRTMHPYAERHGARFAVAGDPRVTPLGRFLRRFNLDELPQLYNVIKGEMSLVGPRPERPVFIEQFRRQLPRYMLRHKVQAGMTGWAQVNGWRGNTSIERRIEHDLYYIEHWSLSLDLKILGLTLLNSFRDRNAY